MIIKTVRHLAVGAMLGLLLCPAVAAAQTWPTRPIRFVLPVPPGGASDILARQMQGPLAEILGQQVIVENKPGGNGVPATDFVVRAAPDGYTIGLIATWHASNPALGVKLPYDSLRDITPIALIAQAPNVLSVHPSVPAQTLPELIAMLKARPGQIHYGSSGNGLSAHFTGELLKLRAGVDAIHVPYRGGGPALNDAVGGQVPIVITTAGSSGPHIRAGRLRGLAVSLDKRTGNLPEVPTFGEYGYPDIVLTEWFGVAGPAGLPPEISRKIADAVAKVMNDPTFSEKLRLQGYEVTPTGPDGFRQFIVQESEKLLDLVRSANIRIE
jgi:tripartite-type tricarboxylate transporter receptor subunit TctC